MNIVECRGSQLASDLTIVTVRCENCGKDGHVAVKDVSKLRTYVCASCGYVNYEKDGARLCKSTREALGEGHVDVKAGVHRTGISRLIRTFNSMKKKNKVDTSVFQSKETFIKWSVAHGYRDWKVLKLNKATGLVDNGARWAPSAYGVNSDVNKLRTVKEFREAGARCLGGALDDTIESLADALNRYDELKVKCNEISQDQNFGAVEYTLHKVIMELNKLSATLDNVM